MPLQAWLSQFVLIVFLTLYNNLVKEGKKNRLIFNTTECPPINSNPINLMTSTKKGTELNCVSGMVLPNILPKSGICGFPSLIRTMPCMPMTWNCSSSNSNTIQMSWTPCHLSFPTVQPHSWIWLQPCQLGTHPLYYRTVGFSTIWWWLSQGETQTSPWQTLRGR